MPVKPEFLELGSSFVESIVESKCFQERFLVSPADLLLLRAVTVFNRREDGDVEDFKWLLALMAKRGSLLPELGGERLKVLVEAAGKLTRSAKIFCCYFYRLRIGPSLSCSINKLYQTSLSPAPSNIFWICLRIPFLYQDHLFLLSQVISQLSLIAFEVWLEIVFSLRFHWKRIAFF